MEILAGAVTPSWDQLVSAHYAPVYALARRMLGNEAEARDAAQETFARAFAHYSEYDSSRRFGAWVLSIAANHVRDLLRRRRGVPLLPDLEIPEFVPPDARLLKLENSAALRSALDDLHPDLKIVVHFVFQQDLSYTEIAGALGLTVNAVRLRLFRALGLLREALKKELP